MDSPAAAVDDEADRAAVVRGAADAETRRVLAQVAASDADGQVRELAPRLLGQR